MKATAVFLDRDGTILEDVGYLDDPDEVRLLPGAATAIRRFRDAGYLVVVVSNQSGVARGLFDESTLTSVHARVESLLEAEGAALDGSYYCPYLDGSEANVNAYRRDSPLRKPEAGMLLEAARELNIDLSRSWMIGDSATDVEAGDRAGCRTVWITGNGPGLEDSTPRPTFRASSLLEAAGLVECDMTQQRDEPVTAPTTRDGETQRILRDIRDLLDRAQRKQRQMDFSLIRLFGALLQMFAVVAALWGIWGLLQEQAAPATARLALACFLQLAAISAFAVDRFR